MPFKIALVNMPFGFHIYPSIQLGTLSTLLKSHGWEAKSYYLNLHFASQIGFPVYNELCEKRHLIGEWLFSEVLFGEGEKNRQYASRYADYIEEVCQSIDRPLDFLHQVKSQMVPEFLNWAVEAIDWSQYSVVGFTSTFNQNIASITLAKLIKERYPDIVTLFGGANFDSEMGLEYCRAFPWIDYAVMGEAEHVIDPLMQAIKDGNAIPKGVIHRQQSEVVCQENTDMFVDFEQYGPPDYDDYFDQLKEIDPQSPFLENPIILYETARGCWWGEKHHCTFCGLNASSMEFRAKSIEQVNEEISALSERYDTFRFRIVDNILELKYIDGVFDRFAKENFDFQIFIEVKSNMNREQIKSLAHGGVNVVQPGIESFSDNQLVDMDKGVRPMQNIFFLKWCMYYGIDVTWNILTGFPGETDEDYRQQIDMIKPLVHFQPPIGVGDLYLERFSPYFTRPGDYGVNIKGPGEAYTYVYDDQNIDLMKISYDFEFDNGNQIRPELVRELQQTVAEWRGRFESDQIPYLIFSKSPNFITVYDGRFNGPAEKTRLDSISSRIIAFCNEKPRQLEPIHDHVRASQANGNGAESVDRAIRELKDRHLLYEERGKYLTLALPMNSHF